MAGRTRPGVLGPWRAPQRRSHSTDHRPTVPWPHAFVACRLDNSRSQLVTPENDQTRAFAELLTRLDPGRRPSAAEALEHAWLNDVLQDGQAARLRMSSGPGQTVGSGSNKVRRRHVSDRLWLPVKYSRRTESRSMLTLGMRRLSPLYRRASTSINDPSSACSFGDWLAENGLFDTRISDHRYVRSITKTTAAYYHLVLSGGPEAPLNATHAMISALLQSTVVRPDSQRRLEIRLVLVHVFSVALSSKPNTPGGRNGGLEDTSRPASAETSKKRTRSESDLGEPTGGQGRETQGQCVAAAKVSSPGGRMPLKKRARFCNGQRQDAQREEGQTLAGSSQNSSPGTRPQRLAVSALSQQSGIIAVARTETKNPPTSTDAPVAGKRTAEPNDEAEVAASASSKRLRVEASGTGDDTFDVSSATAGQRNNKRGRVEAVAEDVMNGRVHSTDGGVAKDDEGVSPPLSRGDAVKRLRHA